MPSSRHSACESPPVTCPRIRLKKRHQVKIKPLRKHFSAYASGCLLSCMAALLLTACSRKTEDKTYRLNDWLRVRRTVSEALVRTDADSEHVELSYAIRKPKTWWFVTFDDWVELDYDEVQVINQKNILASRTEKLARSLFGNNYKPADRNVRLLNKDGGNGSTVCTSFAAISAPAKAGFFDCVDSSDKQKRTVRRTDLSGKLILTVSMDANQWDDLTTADTVSFYDEQQRAYILEVSKDRSYCRLVMPATDKSIGYALSTAAGARSCDDMGAWEKVTQRHLSRAEKFTGLGRDAKTWKDISEHHSGWWQLKVTNLDEKDQEASGK